MNLAISNIAWESVEDESVISVLNNRGIKAIEVAPTKFWDHPLKSTLNEQDDVKNAWLKNGIHLVAMQSLLYGQSHMSLFSSDESRREMIDYLSGIIKLAGRMGVKKLVFGSPKNRQAGLMPLKKQWEIAIPFFYEIGSIAQQEGVVFCIEPNPRQYSCDFITNSEEGIALVKEVAHSGFALHLDAGALALNGEDIPIVLEKSLPYLSHFHISEPFLELVGSSDTPHREISNCLKSLNYNNWVSIEMRNNLLPSNIKSIEKALLFAMEIYA